MTAGFYIKTASGLVPAVTPPSGSGSGSSVTVVLPAPSGANDTPALNAAIAASAPGATITAPPGSTYLLGSPLVLVSNRTYRFGHYNGSNSGIPAAGAGTGIVFRMMNGANLDAVVVTDTIASTTATTVGPPLRIDGMFIDGNRANQTAGRGWGIVIGNFRTVLDHVTVVQARGHGIVFSGVRLDGTNLTGNTYECRVTNCTVDSVGGHGILARKTGAIYTDGMISGTVVAYVGLSGIRIDDGTGWSIHDSHIWACSLDGINVQNAYATWIHDNYVEGFGGNPMFLGTSSTVMNWSSTTTYSRYAIVIHSGKIFYSVADGNLNNTPVGGQSTFWQENSAIATPDLYGILTQGGGVRPAVVHDNFVSAGHPTTNLQPSANYRGIGVSGVAGAYYTVHDNTVANEYQPAGANTLAYQLLGPGSGTASVLTARNRAVGNWAAFTNASPTNVALNTETTL